MVWAELDKTEIPPSRSVNGEPVRVKPEAPEVNAKLLMSHGPAKDGVSEMVPAKIMSAVPSLSGTVSETQFDPNSQFEFAAPPPSHVEALNEAAGNNTASAGK